jgi:hypothetical protein
MNYYCEWDDGIQNKFGLSYFVCLLESWKSWRFESSVVVVFGVTESFVEVTVAISSRKKEKRRRRRRRRRRRVSFAQTMGEISVVIYYMGL